MDLTKNELLTLREVLVDTLDDLRECPQDPVWFEEVEYLFKKIDGALYD